MSKAIRGFYTLTEYIENQLLKDPNCNTVTLGDFSEVDLAKQTIFPLAHIIVGTTSVGKTTLTFTLNVAAMDVITYENKQTTNAFTKSNNTQDIMATQLAVLNKLIQHLRITKTSGVRYVVNDDEVPCEPFVDQYENKVAGWTATMNITMVNDIYGC